MDVEENVKLDMETNVEEALSKLILVKSKDRYLVQYKLLENWKNRNSIVDVTEEVMLVFFNERYVYHHHSVLPKGRSFTASEGTKSAVLPKAGVPPQTQEPRLQFYQG